MLITNCRLCNSTKDIKKSHILPDFIGRWLKRTGATYFRSAAMPNKRIQDIHKQPLLCQLCETTFGKDESIFAKGIFQPYVSKELDQQGMAQSKIKEFKYDKWLLRFAISIQWRILASRERDNNIVLNSFESIWREFLLENRLDTGECETHLIFLSSLAGAKLPNLKLGKRVNTYILRIVDQTWVISGQTVRGIYAKLGPMVLFTSIKPSSLKGNSDSKLHMKGSIKVAQHLGCAWLNQFIFITRPNEAFSGPTLTINQKEKILQGILTNPNRFDSLDFHAAQADLQIKSMD